MTDEQFDIWYKEQLEERIIRESMMEDEESEVQGE